MKIPKIHISTSGRRHPDDRAEIAAQLEEVARLQRELYRAKERYEEALADIEAQRSGLWDGPPRRENGTAVSSELEAPAGGGVATLADDQISIATATLEELRELGLSMTQASRVLDHRERGLLLTPDDIDDVPGIPRGKLAHLKERLKD